jgi:hypothetical protein
MRAYCVLPLIFAIACSSSTSPDPQPLSGTWNATRATLPGTVQQFQVVLRQFGDTITGTATLTPIGSGPTRTFQVVGHAGLDGSSCVIDVQFTCHAQFDFRATEATGDFINFVGGFTASDKIVGDVFSGTDLPFANIDGRELDFAR